MNLSLRHRNLLEPLLGFALLLSWGLTLVFFHEEQLLFRVGLLSAAVAIVRVVPSLGLGLAWAGALSQLYGTALSPNASVLIPAYFALLFVIASAAMQERLPSRCVALASAPALGAVTAFYLVQLSRPILPLAPGFVPAVLADLFTIVLIWTLLTVGLVGAWLLGLGAQNTPAFPGRMRSIIGWLAAPLDAVETSRPRNRHIRELTHTQIASDVIIAAVFVLVCFVTSTGPEPGSAVAIIFGIALAFRRLLPASALAVAWLGALLQMALGSFIELYDLAILAILYSTAAYGSRAVRSFGLVSAGVGGLSAATYLVVEFYRTDITAFTASNFAQFVVRWVAAAVFALSVLGISWLTGLLVRTGATARESRHAQAAAEADQRFAEHAIIVEQERNRIARDMHDVVAHSLAVVIAQANGARYLSTGKSDEMDDALRTISSTAGEALGDVRGLLAELRHSEGGGPQPGIADLPRLIEHMRSTGLNVSLWQQGEAFTISLRQQIALYRIVQEALTNALRHGASTEAVAVNMDWLSTGIAISVVNAAPVSAGEPANELQYGHGVPGIYERANLAGGWARVTQNEETFTVSAFIPSAGPRHEGQQ